MKGGFRYQRWERLERAHGPRDRAPGEDRDQERMVTTDRTGPRRGQRDGAVGGQFAETRDSSAFWDHRMIRPVGTGRVTASLYGVF